MSEREKAPPVDPQVHYNLSAMADAFRVPLLLALAVTFASAVICAALYLILSHWVEIPASIAVGLAGIACAGVFIWTLLTQSGFAIWRLETALQRDLNGDGQVGTPAPVPPLRVVVERQNGEDWPTIDRPDLLQKLAPFLLAGKPFSEGEWVGKFGISGPFFRSWQDHLISQGVFAYRNPAVKNMGVDLTKEGRVILEGLRSRPPMDANPLPQWNGVRR